MSNNINERWLSRRELADRLGLPAKTLAQWAGKGAGPRYARMGRHVRYRLSDVLEWEAAQVEDRRGAVLVGPMRPDSEQVAPLPRRTQRPKVLEGARDDPHDL
jgi:excisionase family DNA binding protein